MTIHELQALAAQLADLPVEGIGVSLRTPLAHQSNRLYDIRAQGWHWIAKEYLKPDEFDDAPQREYGALNLLKHLDIAPQPVHVAPPVGTRGPLVIYEFMAGEMWDRHSPTAGELNQLADLWLTMNAVEDDNLWLARSMEHSLSEIVERFSVTFQRYADWVEADFPQGRAAARLCQEMWAQRRQVLPELVNQKPVLCFCRSDPRFANVIRRPDNRLGLIDWEDSGLLDSALDLADLITHPNQEDLVSQAQWQAFLQPYIAERSRHDPGLARRMHLYLAIVPVFWLTIIINREMQRVQNEITAEWMMNELPASVRFRRYLARALAWPEADFEDKLKDLAGLDFFPA